MPIQIIITAENAAEANQLVQDLAGTMSNMDLADIPEKTEVSTLKSEKPIQAPIQNPTQYQAPTQPMMQPMMQPVQQVQQPTYAPQQPPVQQSAPMQGVVVPTTAQTYTMDQLAVAATQLMEAGKQPELVSLLNSFGVQALTALPKEQYGTFATALRQMGAKL